MRRLSYGELSEVQKEILRGMNDEFDEKTTARIYNSFMNILSSVKDKDAREIIRKLPVIKPIYRFQTVFDLLCEFGGSDGTAEDYNELRKYTGFEIDVFMLANVAFSNN